MSKDRADRPVAFNRVASARSALMQGAAILESDVDDKEVGEKLALRAEFSEETVATIGQTETHLTESLAVKVELLNYLNENGTGLAKLWSASALTNLQRQSDEHIAATKVDGVEKGLSSFNPVRLLDVCIE